MNEVKNKEDFNIKKCEFCEKYINYKITVKEKGYFSYSYLKHMQPGFTASFNINSFFSSSLKKILMFSN